ncbi:MAG TPA: hypothetical protein VFE84_08065 [Patescibacteria group bacterium]|jgi:predicted phosphodiesterase|nr:hypothetical protein [Patescibacteria group bacterium]
MKTIVFGAICGNLPALEASWAEAEKEGYDWIAHTGDVVGFGPYPDECVAFLRDRNVQGARGGFDEGIGWDGDDSGGRESDPAEQALAEASFDWTRRRMDLLDKRWLADLPFGASSHGGQRRVAVYHAGPIDMHDCLTQEMPEARFIEYGEAARADVIAIGCSPRSFHRSIDGRHFLNVASLGRPRDGNPQTGYAVIQADAEVKVVFRRFGYDIDRTVRALEGREAPPGLGERLRKGA